MSIGKSGNRDSKGERKASLEPLARQHLLFSQPGSLGEHRRNRGLENDAKVLGLHFRGDEGIQPLNISEVHLSSNISVDDASSFVYVREIDI